MKTPEEQMRFIVENTDGETWHYKEHNPIYGSPCTCGEKFKVCPSNPSPTSLDDLVRLAEKNGYRHFLIWKHDVESELGKIGCRLNPLTGYTFYGHGEIPADALRNALVKALNHKEG